MGTPGRLVLPTVGLLASGCRFDFDYVSAGERDGAGNHDALQPPATDAGSGGGGGVPLLGPFGPPVELDELATSAGEDDPTLTADLLEIYYNTDRSGSVDIWRATRASAALPFGPPTLVPELSISDRHVDDSTPEVSPDGLTIFLSRTASNGAHDLLISTRAARSEPWGAPVAVTELNSGASDAGAAITDDLSTLFFFSDRAGTYDLYAASRAPAGWSAASLLAELSPSSSYDADPCPAFGGLLLAFSSDRLGDFDLFAATRASNEVPFDPPVPIVELNTSMEERDPWISPDGRVIYFESFRAGGYHIFTARR